MQQSIRIYTPYMDLLHETDNYLSLQFTPKFYEVGEFEVHVNQYTEGAEYFQKNNLIMLDKQKDKVGIIRHREIALDESGKLSENWKITGVALKGVLSQRVTIPPSDTGYDRKSGDAETVMKYYVEKHFINPNDTDRQIDHIEVAPNKNRGAHIEWESRFKNVDEEITAISKQANLGWVMYADMVKKKWIFDVVEQRDVTQGNEAGLQPVFFSPDFQTIKTQQFIDSDVNLKNFGYVGGQGKGVDRLVEKIGVSKGLQRLEAFIDARDVGGSGEEDLTPEQIQQKLIERGQSKLDEMKTDFYLEAQILTPTINDNSGRFSLKTPFEYEVDFRLGDTVEVFNKKWNITMDAPITAFKEIHEVGGFVLEAIFGEAQPTLISKIKGKFDEISGIEQQELPVQIAVERMQEAKSYSDANLSVEEKARIAQALANLEESLNYTDDQDVIYDNLAKEYAEAARIAAEAVAVAEAELAETNAKSYADGIVTTEEAARIAQDKADLAEAKAAANLAETQAKAYADGVVSDEEARAIADAQAKLALAKADATDKDVIVFEDGKTYSEDASNLNKGVINVGAVPIRTATSGARIVWDGTNGLVQYDQYGNIVFHLTLAGNGLFRGEVVGGSITSDTDINVTEDLFAGNNITAGASYSNFFNKGFWIGSSIRGKGMYIRGNLDDVHIGTGGTGQLILNTDGRDIIASGTIYGGNIYTDNITARGDITVDGDINADNVFTDYADKNRLKLEAGTTQIFLDPANGTIYFLSNGLVKHEFRSSGTKIGGSIEIDGVNLGMSPVDSPQIRISTLIMDVELLAGVEKEITFESQFAKAITQYAVFPSQPVAIRKESGKFYAKSEVDCTCDFNVDGYRIGHENTYWQSMEL